MEYLHTRINPSENKVDSVSEIPDMLITIEVSDPIGLAKKRSDLAKLVGDMLPIMVKRIVYEEVRKETIKELQRQNVEATVKIQYW